MSSNATLKLFKSIDDDSYTNASDAIKAGADVNALHDGYTPLMRAALLNRASLIRLLLWQKADPEFSEHRSALDIAWSFNSQESFCALARHRTSIKGPFWLKPNKQIATRVLDIPSTGILCEHFDFADKMCTSVLYEVRSDKIISHSRASFNSVSRHLVLEAEKIMSLQKQKSKYKRADL
jgi:hypothetical protein